MASTHTTIPTRRIPPATTPSLEAHAHVLQVLEDLHTAIVTSTTLARREDVTAILTTLAAQISAAHTQFFEAVTR